MEKQTERKYHFWFSWQYEQEESWINDWSSKGLHWQKGGFWSSTLQRDSSARYTYRMDYQPSLKGDKLEEYLTLYRDAGWEYTGCYSKTWHYFRKDWQPGESPKLYTDRESLAALYKRLRQLMVMVLLINLFALSMNSINLMSRIHHLWGIIVPVYAFYALIFSLLGIGIIQLGRKIKSIAP